MPWLTLLHGLYILIFNFLYIYYCYLILPAHASINTICVQRIYHSAAQSLSSGNVSSFIHPGLKEELCWTQHCSIQYACNLEADLHFYPETSHLSFLFSQVGTTIVLQLLTAAFDIVGFGLIARHVPFRGESYYYRDTEVNICYLRHLRLFALFNMPMLRKHLQHNFITHWPGKKILHQSWTL